MTGSVLVTGGTGGLGTAVTTAFAAAGWRVVVPYRSRPPSGVPDVVGVQADLTDPAQVAAAVAVAAAEGPLRAVVHLAGGFAMGGRVHETPVEDFEAQFRTNLRPTYLVCAAAIPHLIAAGGGSIVCVSSRAAVNPFAGAAGYVTSKAAVLALVDALDTEYRDDGIRVNAVLPGVIDTPANRESMPGSRSNWVDPADIAKTILFLSSEESSTISGAHLPVDRA
ncbi:SDR family NAD(P)-dependent oxidoreductase [Actinophytocola algeriensis]|uniref:NAD(P)-dependent dehydrogenase (Short-subunit alcohol dehydrogenase family) n=1 Tax=Actinophytocola algeriensis TaxID=1768010 RepID=A0A7W7Q648_9PSEU|nr:SDR family NAD(P)-dependent oxidoreductase [Actinophytocola algeriensis]MBB4907776.1 NAD(P)-dependent dehydrogenase (short-subunit alcohol dehydrogenase family) [Actinophytocola algeriensis]MBE1479806.1 NAD(P)-dependent dehydrogenase (short-subunit alcohol dehydrogenase family) [Actinophytocola algeriensis]